jgi:hypothetical protein
MRYWPTVAKATIVVIALTWSASIQAASLSPSNQAELMARLHKVADIEKEIVPVPDSTYGLEKWPEPMRTPPKCWDLKEELTQYILGRLSWRASPPIPKINLPRVGLTARWVIEEPARAYETTLTLEDARQFRTHVQLLINDERFLDKLKDAIKIILTTPTGLVEGKLEGVFDWLTWADDVLEFFEEDEPLYVQLMLIKQRIHEGGHVLRVMTPLRGNNQRHYQRDALYLYTPIDPENPAVLVRVCYYIAAPPNGLYFPP